MKPRALPSWLVYAPLLVLLAALIASWNLPVLEQHGFRQAQTLLSSYWMTHGGPWWLYHTPVLGYPWAIPFEFPLYQWGVALLAMLPLGLNVDTAGRLLSLACLVACSWPLRVALRNLGASGRMVDFSTLLFLSSPLHVFWGRAAMIESTALLVAMLFLVAIQRLVAGVTPTRFLAVLVLATLSALVKITTFFPFALLAGALVAWRLVVLLREGGRRDALRLAVAAAVPMAVAIGSLMAWLAMSDQMKMGSVLAEFSTSGNLSKWNINQAALGELRGFWIQVVLGRMIPDILGHAAWLAPLAVFAMLPGRGRYLAWMTGGVALFLAPMLVFTKLHETHNYYQMANATFLLVALAAAMDAAAGRWRREFAIGLGLLALAGMMLGFHGGYWRSIQDFDRNHPSLAIADVLRRNTRPDDVLVLLGLNWSSEVPYYAGRRAVMLLKDGHLPFVLPTLREPGGSDRPLDVGAIARCGAQRADISGLVTMMCGPLKEIDVAGCSIVVRRDPGRDEAADEACRQEALQRFRDSLAPPPPGELALGDFSREWLPYAASESCNIEFIGKDAIPLDAFGRDERMTVIGWMHDGDAGAPPVSPHLRLRSEVMERSWYVPLALGQARPDIAQVFDGTAANAGFSASLALGQLPPGDYELMLVDLAPERPKLCRPQGKLIRVREP